MELTVWQFAEKVERSYPLVSRMVDRVFPCKQGTGRGRGGRVLSDSEQEMLIKLLPPKRKRDLNKANEGAADIYSKDFWVNPFLEDDDDDEL